MICLQICRPQFSGICGGTSYGHTSNPSLAWTKLRFQKNEDDDDDDDDVKATSSVPRMCMKFRIALIFVSSHANS